MLLELSEVDEIAGQVVWKDGSRAGVKFHEELSEEALRRLVEPEIENSQEDKALRDNFGRPLPPLGAQIRLI